jgi:hypothetical protein
MKVTDEEAEMHPFLQAQLAVLHQEDLRHDAAAAGRRRRVSEPGVPAESAAEVVIRRSTADDASALAALSALDGVQAPSGASLVAEVEGTSRAVLPLDGSRAFADPFLRTKELVDLLELRAAQLRRERAPRSQRRLAWMAPMALRRLI